MNNVLFANFALVPFLQAAAGGKLSRQDYICWGQQMLHLAVCFKKSMARGIEQALSTVPPALSVGCCLAGNLYDEFGQGIEGCCHIELLTKFITFLGGQPYAGMLETTQICVKIHEQISAEGLASNLGIIWANEVCCPIEFRAIRQGVEQLCGDLPMDNLLRYLDINLGADVEHSQNTSRVLAPYALVDPGLSTPPFRDQ